MSVRKVKFNRSDLIERFNDKGYKFLGNGAYSHVYRHRRNHKVCFKIGREIDEGWVHYARMVMKDHAGNPFAPKIYWLRICEAPDGSTYYVAKMKTLKGMVHDKDRGHKDHLLYKGARELVWTRAAPPPNSLVSLANSIRELGRGYDMHNANAMYDGDQLVITDPVT